jgi:hypothetical protein
MLNGIFDPGAETPEYSPPATPEEKAPPSTPAAAPSHAKFVGSKNSQVYHLPGCKDAQRIKPENLVEYDEAPAGKRLHEGCPK